MKLKQLVRCPMTWVVVALVAVIVATVAARARRSHTTTEVQTAAVERRSIAVTIEATGTVEPIDLVEVKSKASGQIVRMSVAVGSLVKAGDLLAQIDTRDVKNQYDQTLAALRAAQSHAAVSTAQRRRADQLYKEQVITAPEHETAVLSDADSRSSVVRARTDLDLARQRLEDATVRAPITGTVLEQLVSNGQVISSATSSASGGTSLLKMADLDRIRIRALVAETDVGNVHPGQNATVTVDAFPNRSFQGVVEKIEPQAVVQQSVTMFPVLVSISNEQHLLLPGMNGEVTMLVDERDNVLAVPVDAVRSAREVAAVAPVLGLDPRTVQADLQKQMDERQKQFAAMRDSMGAGMGFRGGAVGDSTRRGFGMAGGDSARRARWRARMAGGFGGGGGGFRRGGGGGFGGGAGGPGGGGGFAAGAGGAGGFGGASFGGRAGSRSQVVFVKTKSGYEPRLVRTGISDFDYTQVLSGVNEGEQVAMLGVAEAMARREQDQSRIRQRMGNGLPGSAGAGGGRGAAGGGGGARGGGGGGR